MTELKPCGTVAAAQRHYKAGEPLCPDCYRAWRDYQTEWRRNHPRPRKPSVPRVSKTEQLASEAARSDQLAVALSAVVCDDCEHDYCHAGRRALMIWATARGLHHD